jgi:hypothetical protein
VVVVLVSSAGDEIGGPHQRGVAARVGEDEAAGGDCRVRERRSDALSYRELRVWWLTPLRDEMPSRVGVRGVCVVSGMGRG